MGLEAAQQAGAPPHWMGTVSVADIDGSFARAVELGAQVHAPIHEIPNVGKFAVLADPTGASFCIMQSSNPAPAVNQREIGQFSWSELWTSDPAAAWTFYSGRFGWIETCTMEMAPGDVYRMFGRTTETTIGGIAKQSAEGSPSAWLFYATVENADRPGDRAKALGAHVFMGPMEVPGGGRILAGMDPQGAGFAVYSHATP